MVIKLKNNKTGKEYVFKGVVMIRDTLDYPITKMSMPGQDSGEARLISFSGQTRRLTIQFTLTDREDDASNGTNGGTEIKTISEQYNYLFELLEPDINIDYTFIWSDLGLSLTCVFTSLSFDSRNTDPLKVDGQINLIVGKNVL